MSNSSAGAASTHRFPWWLFWYAAVGVLFYGAGAQITKTEANPVGIGIIVFALYGICVPMLILSWSPNHKSNELDEYVSKFIFGCFVGGCVALTAGVVHGIIGG